MKEDTANKNSLKLKNTGKYVIPSDRAKKVKEIILPLLGSLALCVFVVLFDVEKFRELVPADNIFDNFIDNIAYPFVKVLSYIIIPIIVFTLIIKLKNIPSIKHLLYIDEKGFEENLSSNPVGFVAWSDVEKLEVKPFFTAKFYGITLKSPEKYYKNDKNQAIMFTSQLFNDKADEVEQIIRYHIDKNK